jgi:hypothetical protein
MEEQQQWTRKERVPVVLVLLLQVLLVLVLVQVQDLWETDP